MKKYCICALVIYLIIFSIFSMYPVEANTIFQTCSYYDIPTFTFKGTSNSNVEKYDGTFMAIEASATSSSGKTYDVTIHVIIHSIGKEKTYILPSNGSTQKYDYIYIGLSASSNVTIYCTCDASENISVKLKTYSW